MVTLLTDEKYRGKMVVILAGYEAEVDALMAANPGLKSRFSEKLHFPDFTQEAATKLLLGKLSRDYALEPEQAAMERLPGLMDQLIQAPGWSNGRDVGTWAKRIFQAYALRTQGGSMAGGSSSSNGYSAVTAEDLVSSLKSFIQSKGPPGQLLMQNGAPGAAAAQFALVFDSPFSSSAARAPSSALAKDDSKNQRSKKHRRTLWTVAWALVA